MQLIETRTLTSTTPSVNFSSIPDTFNDLYILVSGRVNDASNRNVNINFNGVLTNQTRIRLSGDGSSPTSASATQISSFGDLPGSGSTADTFGNLSAYIQNYTKTNPKSVSIDAVGENVNTLSWQTMSANNWNSADPITSISILPNGGHSFVAGSKFWLYGIGGVGDGGPLATGGIIMRSGDYWYHTFTSSGTFTPTTAIADAEVLTIAGGGAAGSSGGGTPGAGGGAGDLVFLTTSLTNTSYAITVGAGGAGSVNAQGGIGGPSSFGVLSTANGGGGGGNGAYQTGIDASMSGASSNGGGGGGGCHNGTVNRPGGTGDTNSNTYGKNGGDGRSVTTGSSGTSSGGGGGLAVAGVAGAVNVGGSGGNGTSDYSVWGLATGSGEVSGGVAYFGGGGAGASAGDTVLANAFPGGLGGGGRGGRRASGSVGTANTGGGGGGGAELSLAGKNGGSGIVIVRYLVA